MFFVSDLCLCTRVLLSATRVVPVPARLHIKCNETHYICPWDTLACCIDLKQLTNNMCFSCVPVGVSCHTLHVWFLYYSRVLIFVRPKLVCSRTKHLSCHIGKLANCVCFIFAFPSLCATSDKCCSFPNSFMSKTLSWCTLHEVSLCLKNSDVVHVTCGVPVFCVVT